MVYVAFAVVFLLAVAAIASVEALVIQWAWGVLAVGFFHANPLSFVQAFAVCVVLTLVGSIFRSSSKE